MAGHSSSSFPKARSPHVLVTTTTIAQSSTEDEVSPFFVDLSTLSNGQLNHLRDVGLLPPLPPPSSSSYAENENENDDDARRYAIRLLRDAHESYLSNSISDTLPRGFVSLDASRPWMVYWCLHSLDLLGHFDDGGVVGGGGGVGEVDDDEEMAWRGKLLDRMVSTLIRCWSEVDLIFDGRMVEDDPRLRRMRRRRWMMSIEEGGGTTSTTTGTTTTSTDESVVVVPGGGFGGGPGQMPHCAPTYAAVLSLSIIAGLGGGTGASAAAAKTTTTTTKRTREHYREEAGRRAMEFLSGVRCMLYAYFLSLREEYDDDDAEGRDDEYDDDDDDDDDEDAMMTTTTTTMRGRTAFRMHHDGEVDVRATYCVLTSCYLLKLLDREGDDDGDENDDGRGGCSINPLLSPSVSRYVASCQTYEGGFGAEPNNEAHGGYAFCAIASLRLLLLHRSSGGAAAAGGGGRRLSLHDVIDVNALSSWLSRRQMGYEGGFSGRTNKLVDGCYSFWQGGAIAALDGCPRPGEEEEGGGEHDDEDDDGDGEARDGRRSPTFDEAMLQRYILLCAQDVNGGLRDKPSKSRDFYHSCYNLSGLSVAQHALGPWPPTSATSLSSSTSTTTAADAAVDGHDGGDEAGGEEEEKEVEEVEEEVRGETRLNRLFGDASFNVVGRTDPVINIRVERVRFMLSRRYR